MESVNQATAGRTKPVSAACADNMCGNCWSDECGHTCHPDTTATIHLLADNPTLTGCGQIVTLASGSLYTATDAADVDCAACLDADPSVSVEGTTEIPLGRTTRDFSTLSACLRHIADLFDASGIRELATSARVSVSILNFYATGEAFMAVVDQVAAVTEVAPIWDGASGDYAYYRTRLDPDAPWTLSCQSFVRRPAEWADLLQRENEQLRARLAELEAKPAVEPTPEPCYEPREGDRLRHVQDHGHVIKLGGRDEDRTGWWYRNESGLFTDTAYWIGDENLAALFEPLPAVETDPGALDQLAVAATDPGEVAP